jgi:hypothetical protein
MYLFVDESGTNRQTGVCSFVAVIVKAASIPALNRGVIAVEKLLGIETFHWSGTAWPLKEKFINELNNYDFRFVFQINKNPLTNFNGALESLLLAAADGLIVSGLIIDGKKGKNYERNLKKALRDKKLPTKKLRTGNDESYPALRVADAIAGLVRSHYNKPTPTSKKLMKLLESKLKASISAGQPSK